MSEPRDDGGPAFPSGGASVNVPPWHYYSAPEPHAGMSMRDYFAASALMGMFASNGLREVMAEIKEHPHAFCFSLEELVVATNERVAAMAYAMADAMLHQRREVDTEAVEAEAGSRPPRQE